MFSKIFYSLLGLLFITNRLVFAEDEVCDVNTGKNCIQNTYNLINKENYSVINDEDELKEGSLYYCSGEPVKCSEIIDVGYYVVDSSTVYICQDIGAGLTCKKDSIDETITSCTAASVGKLFVESISGSINLCLSYLGSPTKKPLSITLNIGSSGTYLLEKNDDAAANVFGITGSNDRYAIIKVKDKVVTLFSTYDNGLKYVYVNAVTSKVMERGDKNCPPKAGTAELDEDNILELSCFNGKCKTSESEIILNTVVKGINVLKNDAGTISTVSKSDLDSAEATDIAKMGIYNCDGKGYCEKIPGYIIKEATFYKVDSSSAAPASVTVPTKAATDCKNNVGLIIDSSGNKLCLDEGVVGEIATGNSFIFGTSGISEDSPFTNVANRMVTITDTYIAIDSEFAAENSKDYFIKNGVNFLVYKYMQATGTFNPDDVTDIMVYQKIGSTNVYKEINLSNTAPFPDKASVASWTIFDCIKGTCKQAYGYVKSNEDTVRYFVIPQSGSSNNDIIASTSISANCATSDSGKKLKTGGALCVSYSDSNPVSLPMENGKTYIITGAPLIADFHATSSDKIIIKATSNTLTYSANYDDIGTNLLAGYQKISKRQITTQNKTTLSLYNCLNTGICTLIPGYVLNSNTFYTISATPASNTYTPSEADSCTGKVGEIIQKEGSYYLCLTADLDVDITHLGNYVLGTLASTNVFTNTNSNKLIKITEDFVVLDTITGAQDNNEYIIKIDNIYKSYRIANSGANYNAETTSIIYIYKSVDDHDNVIKFVNDLTSISAETDLSGHKIFKCINGDCIDSVGYVLGGTGGTAKIYSNIGNDWEPVSDGACEANEDFGNTYLNTNHIQLCMPISTTPTKTTVTTSSYLLKKANTSYMKYTGNAATSTIVIIEEPVVGSYVVANTNIIAITGDTPSTGNLISCSGTTISCSAKSIASLTEADAGYYYNPHDITMIISCENSTSKCTLAAPTVIGYYKTVDSKYILWDGSKTSIASIMTCSSDTIGQWDTTANKLCLDGTKSGGFASSGTDVYYLLNYHENSIFKTTIDDISKYGLVKATKTTINLDAVGSDVNYCVNMGTLVATAKSGNCASGSNIYKCNTGVCTPEYALPNCEGAADGSAVCINTLSSVTKTYCVPNNLKEIYESTPSACTAKIATLTSGNYYIFKCTDSNTCLLVDLATDTLTGSDKLLIYKLNSDTLEQQKSFNYYTANKLFSCNAEGICTFITTAGYAKNPNTDTNNSFADKPILQIAEGGTVTTILKAAVKAIIDTKTAYYLDVTSMDKAGRYTKLVKCTGDVACESYSTLTTELVYPNAVVTNSVNEALIKANGNEFKLENAINNGYYVNGETGLKFLIKCTSAAGCKKETGKTNGRYFDENTKSGENYLSIIKCTAADACATAAAVPNDVGFYVNNADSKLMECFDDSGTKKCKVPTTIAIGYYKNSATPAEYAKCTSATACVSEEKDAQACGSANSNIGKIDSTGALCLDDQKTGTFAAEKYLVNYGSTSNFPSALTKEANKYFLVQGTSTSITISKLSSATDICGDDNFKYVTDKGAQCASGKTNYACATTSLCAKGVKEA